MRKRKWFMLGLIGTLIGMATRLLKGRREEQVELGRWDPPTEE